jgi:hypothetical protein
MSELVLPIAGSTQGTTERYPDKVTFNPVDLTRALARSLTPLEAPYVPGKTTIRDAVMAEMSCSAETAESLVDRLEADGYLKYIKPRAGIGPEFGYWSFVSDPRRAAVTQR